MSAISYMDFLFIKVVNMSTYATGDKHKTGDNHLFRIKWEKPGRLKSIGCANRYFAFVSKCCSPNLRLKMPHRYL